MTLRTPIRHQDRTIWISAPARFMAKPYPIISPSILAADFGILAEECGDILSNEGGAAEWIHVDVMDGHFVPNLSIGPCVIASLRQHFPDVFLDVHCMISEPIKWVKEMANAGASQMTFHIEATDNPRAVARAIRAAGMQCGIALKPDTPITPELRELLVLKLIDMVLIMTVEPGFGGQSFIEKVVPKIRDLRSLFHFLNIEVDGGINGRTIRLAAEAGANVIVAGTNIFRADDRAAVMNNYRSVVMECINAKGEDKEEVEQGDKKQTKSKRKSC